ncbi:hypothetical protein ASC76_10315 [Rhizobacter sp. Root404]|nr:hypothetical protein ASC76_10315 [Rhizobacter sp. Root404]
MLSDCTLNDLTDWAARQLIPHIIVFRGHYSAKSLPAHGANFIDVKFGAWLELQDSCNSLAPLLVRLAHDRAVLNRRMRQHNLLHFTREDVESTSNDHVLDAINNVNIAFAVPVPNISRVVPTESAHFL